MIHLKTYESFDIDKYKAFISKYKKSDYISVRSLKTMKELGIERAFSKMKEDVTKCYHFFKRIDTELLDELLLEVEHEYATIKDGNIQYKVSVRPEYPLKDFTVIVEHYGKWKSEVDVVDHIIRNITSEEETERQKIKDNRNDSWYRYTFSRMKWMNYYENVKINPVIKITLNLGIDIDDIYYNPFGGGEEPHQIKDRRKKITDIKKLLEEEIFIRYLDYMGYHNTTFTVQQVNNSYYDTGNSVSFEIKLKDFIKK